MNFVNSHGAFNAAVGLGPTSSPAAGAAHLPTSAQRRRPGAGGRDRGRGGLGHHRGLLRRQRPLRIPRPASRRDLCRRRLHGAATRSLTASDYASGFISNIYPNRRVPDLCGLVGLQPKAIYIMFPLEPGDRSTSAMPGGPIRTATRPPPSDGWAAFSGTSAAAPQLAGVAALIKQACPHLKPAGALDPDEDGARRHDRLLQHVPSTHGASRRGRPDTATGKMASSTRDKAVVVAKLRCLAICRSRPLPIQSDPAHTDPSQSSPFSRFSRVRSLAEPLLRSVPYGRCDQSGRSGRSSPSEPIRPIRPIPPIEPIRPIRPIQPIEPFGQAQPAPQAGEQNRRLSPAEGRVPLEEMALRGEIGFRDIEDVAYGPSRADGIVCAPSRTSRRFDLRNDPA